VLTHVQVPRFEWFYVNVDNVSKRVGPMSDPMKKFFNHKGAQHVITKNKKKYVVRRVSVTPNRRVDFS
jgi:hypothetical protein